eukprot:TRINITY_DN43847_c0_g1_i1.p1 TRINITY_DN43847_c0_g1~~TRINITY_DN43847_c0_g1_i1.p1  ORF type:complete len:625 (+),score=91.13 TRINITY_DN43847_c0_g1_i1:175-2049(+)
MIAAKIVAGSSVAPRSRYSDNILAHVHMSMGTSLFLVALLAEHGGCRLPDHKPQESLQSVQVAVSPRGEVLSGTAEAAPQAQRRPLVSTVKVPSPPQPLSSPSLPSLSPPTFELSVPPPWHELSEHYPSSPPLTRIRPFSLVSSSLTPRTPREVPLVAKSADALVSFKHLREAKAASKAEAKVDLDPSAETLQSRSPWRSQASLIRTSVQRAKPSDVTAQHSNVSALAADSPGAHIVAFARSKDGLGKLLEVVLVGAVAAASYLLAWYFLLPEDQQPGSIASGYIKWLETQDESEDEDSVNCLLVKLLRLEGLPDAQKPAKIEVKMTAYDETVEIGQWDCTDASPENGEIQAAFASPVLDNGKEPVPTLSRSGLKVEFTLKANVDENPRSVATVSLSPHGSGSAASSSTLAHSGHETCTGRVWTPGALEFIGKSDDKIAYGTLHVQAKACFIGQAGTAVLTSPIIADKIAGEMKKPWSTSARALATALTVMLLLTCLPLVGNIFHGCFFLSVHGLATSATLLCMTVPHWLSLLKISVNPWLSRMGIDSLRLCCTMLASSGYSGVGMCFMFSSTPCTDDFWPLEILIVGCSILYGVAWWKGEGGGMMGALNSVGSRLGGIGGLGR